VPPSRRQINTDRQDPRSVIDNACQVWNVLLSGVECFTVRCGMCYCQVWNVLLSGVECVTVRCGMC
jgi:hypothetical protein